MRWIRTLGGPLLVLPEGALASWWGACSPDGENDVDEEATQYWQVSEEVQDYAGVITVGDSQAIAIANGFAATRYLPSERLLVQVIAGDIDLDDVTLVRGLVSTVSWDHQFTWRVEEPCLLFDSVRYGPSLTPDDYVRLVFPIGEHLVRCAYRDADRRAPVDLSLIQLAPVGGSTGRAGGAAATA